MKEWLSGEIFSSAFETEVEALCERLRGMGLNATVESKKSKRGRVFGLYSLILGSAKVVNRNIDLVELELILIPGEDGCYRCVSYVVQAKVNGLEGRLRAKGKPVRKSFLSRQVVDFKWKGRELAQVLNGDANLRDTLCRMDIPRYLNASLQIKPDKKHQRVRIRPIETAFPSVEALEVYDRIAQHIRSIANVLPDTQKQ